MLRLQCTITLLTALLTSYTAAQTASTVQGDWIAPALPDTSTTLTLGETYELQWTSHLQTWFSEFAPNASISDVDLWITPSNGVTGETLIASSIDVALTYSYSWTVSITPSQLAAAGGEWTFRFLKADTSYTVGGQQISSPQVIVQNSPSSSSAAVASSTSAAASKSTASATPTTPASAASTSTSSSTAASATAASTPSASPKSSSGISAGEAAGIAIGSVAVVLALGLIAFFVRKHYRQKQKLGSSEPTAYSGHLMSDYKYNPHRSAGSSGITPQEHHSGPNELEGHGYNGPSELDGNRYR